MIVNVFKEMEPKLEIKQQKHFNICTIVRKKEIMTVNRPKPYELYRTIC